MNSDAREKLILELEHLLQNKPVMGTLIMTVRETPCMGQHNHREKKRSL
jgi:hypothetical protein